MVGVCAGIVLAGVLLIAGQYWIIPAVARSQIRSAAGDYWGGEVAFNGFEFSYVGPVRLRGLELRDEQGRTWARIESVVLTLRDMPGVHPLLSEVNVDGVELTAHFRDGRCDPPLLEPPEREPSDLGAYVDLERVTVRNVTFGLSDERGRSLRTDPLRADLVREGNVYRLDAVWGSGDSPPLLARGTIDPTGPVDVTCTIDKTLTDPTGRTLLAILRNETLRALGGRVRGEIRVQGSAAEPAGVRPRGELQLRQWHVTTRHGELVGDFSGDASVRGTDAIEMDVTDLHAEVAEGRLTGVVAVRARPDDIRDTFRFQGRTKLEQVSVSELSRLLRGEATAQRGTLSGQLEFTGLGLGLDDLRAAGALAVNDAGVDDVRFRLLDAVLDKLGLGATARERNVDASATFRLAHSVVTFEDARMALPVAALAVLPGGTADLATRELDLYVVGAPLSDLKNWLGRLELPIVDLVTGLTQRLTALHVKGRWDDPPARLVRVAPMPGLDQEVATFFRDTVRTGGELPARTLDVFGKVLTAPVKILEGIGGRRDGGSEEAAQE